jgi:hypothetical protein
MEATGWLLAGVDAAATAVLLVAGLGKLVSPALLRRALAEVTPAIGGIAGNSIVRGLAVAELIVASALLLPAGRPVAALMTAVLGLCFATVGVLAAVRHVRVPCGCFGSSSRRPLGWSTVGTGLALALVYPVNAVLARPGTDGGYPTGATLLASMASVVLCLWVNRALVSELVIQPRRAALDRSEVA